MNVTHWRQLTTRIPGVLGEWMDHPDPTPGEHFPEKCSWESPDPGWEEKELFPNHVTHDGQSP